MLLAKYPIKLVESVAGQTDDPLHVYRPLLPPDLRDGRLSLGDGLADLGWLTRKLLGDRGQLLGDAQIVERGRRIETGFPSGTPSPATFSASPSALLL